MNQQQPLNGVAILRHRTTRETKRFCPRSYICPACGNYVSRNEDGKETAWLDGGPDGEPRQEPHEDVCNG